MLYRQPVAIVPSLSLSAKTQVYLPEAYGNTGGMFTNSPGQAEFSFGNREPGCTHHPLMGKNKHRLQHQYPICSQISLEINKYNLLKGTDTLCFLQTGCFRNSKPVRTPGSRTGIT